MANSKDLLWAKIFEGLTGGAVEGVKYKNKAQQEELERALKQKQLEEAKRKNQFDAAATVAGLTKPTSMFDATGKYAGMTTGITPDRENELRSMMGLPNRPTGILPGKVAGVEEQPPEAPPAVSQTPAAPAGLAYLGGRPFVFPSQHNNRPSYAEKPTSTQFIDSSDNTPLLLDPVSKRLIRADGSNQPPKGQAIPVRGNASAVSESTQAANILPQVQGLFADLKTMSPMQRKLALSWVGGATHPALKQTLNELSLTGFAIGGKQLTGPEKKVVMGALIPSFWDDDAALEAKELALTEFLSGKIDLAGAANLLGPAGGKLQAIVNKYTQQSGIADDPLGLFK